MSENDFKSAAVVRAEVPDAWNRVTESIISAAIEVHSLLGPGLSEKLCEEAMDFELRQRSMSFTRQVAIRVAYKTILLPEQRLDLLVESLVIVELKAVDRVPDAHLAALVGYLHAADMPLGLLINFHAAHLKQGIYRRINSRAILSRAQP